MNIKKNYQLYNHNITSKINIDGIIPIDNKQDKEIYYMYTVKEAAKILNLTTHAIRYYTDKGLVPNIIRDKNNNRLFDERALRWLEGIKRLKECGMPIADIKNYVDLCLEGISTIEERYAIILEQKKRTEQQLQEVQQRLAYLEKKSNHYLEIINHQVADDTNPNMK